MDYKDNFKNIEVPMEADLVIERAIKRAKNRHKKRFLKVSSGIAAVFALSILLGKTSPAFAEYINNATAPVKNLFGHFGNKGIDNAVKNGFVQEVSKDSKTSASDKGITVTIDQVAIGGNKLNIGYTLKADEKYKEFDNLYYDKFKITDNKGRVLYDSADPGKSYYGGFDHKTINNEGFKDTRVKQGIFEFMSGKTKDEIPDSITIEFYDFSDTPSLYASNKNKKQSAKIIEGKWTTTVKIDDKFKNAKEMTYVKAFETAENSNIKIEYINVYPTTANAKFLCPKDMDISNVRLEDEKGNKYASNTGSYGMGSINSDHATAEPDFESPYFDKIEKLYLVFDGNENGKNKNFKIELKKQ